MYFNVFILWKTCTSKLQFCHFDLANGRDHTKWWVWHHMRYTYVFKDDYGLDLQSLEVRLPPYIISFWSSWRTCVCVWVCMHVCLHVLWRPRLIWLLGWLFVCLCVCLADAQQVCSARQWLGTPGTGTIRAHPTGSKGDWRRFWQSFRQRFGERQGKLCSLRSARAMLIFAYFSQYNTPLTDLACRHTR